MRSYLQYLKTEISLSHKVHSTSFESSFDLSSVNEYYDLTIEIREVSKNDVSIVVGCRVIVCVVPNWNNVCLWSNVRILREMNENNSRNESTDQKAGNSPN